MTEDKKPDDGEFERALSFFLGSCEAQEVDMWDRYDAIKSYAYGYKKLYWDLLASWADLKVQNGVLLERATEILNDLCCQIDTRKSPRVPDDAKYHELCKQCWDALGITEYTGKHIAEHIKELRSPRVPVIEILETVLEQAEDEGLWFNAKYASEAYLQQELRRLHAVIERAYAELQKGV